MVANKVNYYESNSKTPTIDGGLGLIIRLNILFNKADRSALAGDMDEWNNILDRIYVNLCYRTPMDIEIDDKGKVTKLCLDEEDQHIFNEFLNRIRNVKFQRYSAIQKRSNMLLEKAKQDHYNLLMLKDIWLRKLMNSMGLYMKEIEFNPATAMFGG